MTSRNEDGFALIAAIILLTVIMGLGVGLLLFSDNQQRAASREQAGESSFNVSEAALNAEIGQLSRAWPGSKALELPERCTATSPESSACPTAASLSAGYSYASALSCPAGTPSDPWGSPLTNRWTTYVRDDGEGTSSLFNSAIDQKQPSWDANGDGKVWVRSVGVVQCRVVTVVTLVSEQLVATNFPHNAATGNWFKVTNNGKKVIVNTAGEPPVSQPGEISMRCSGVSAGSCEEWDESKEQISPNTTKAPASPSQTLSEAQLADLRSQAIAAGTFYSGANGTCPSNTTGASGFPTYIEGCGALKLTGGVGNSAGAPGFMILADGTLELLGNAEYFGEIYARNPTNLNTAVVTLGGTAQVKGGIDVDGNGGIEFGSSKANLIYDPTAINQLKIYAGAAPTRNTFRVLPINQ
jgi:Tfp pilus assembly protein PilX